MVDKRDRQLSQQKAGLIKLATLHQSVESNHFIVIHHLGQQLVQVRSTNMKISAFQGFIKRRRTFKYNIYILLCMLYNYDNDNGINIIIIIC